MKKQVHKKILPTIAKTKSVSKEYTFFADVHEVVRQIPKGRVTTYGAIATYLGTALSARMVGWAMNAAHQIMPTVPAHRVVNRNGQLTGKLHFETPDQMEQLLMREKIKIVDDKIVDFKSLFWDPTTELGL